ncbi:uncharacterized protein RHO17_022187 [Thomomys bottae]
MKQVIIRKAFGYHHFIYCSEGLLDQKRNLKKQNKTKPLLHTIKKRETFQHCFHCLQTLLHLPSISVLTMAEGEGVVHMSSTFLKLWLWLLVFYSGWPGIGYMQDPNPPEVVIPLKLTGHGRNNPHPRWLSYSLHFGGQRYIIHMKVKKFLISEHFSVFSYTDQGAVLMDEPFFPNNCYYHGYVQGDPNSLVVLSNCLEGFQGTLKVNNTHYEIKPKKLSTTFEHLVYKMESVETHLPTMRCALTEEEIAQLKFQDIDKSMQRQSGYKDWWTHRNFLDLVLVVDNQRYIHRGSNTSNVVKEVFAILNEVNSLFYSVDVDTVLRGLEIWNNKNFVADDKISGLLLLFCHWKRKSLNPRIKSDVGHLFVQQDFDIALGLAYIGSVCNINFNCGVDRVMGEDLSSIGHIVAHEIGHNLGMLHDDENVCICEMEECIMAPVENESTKFSNCSYSHLRETMEEKECLRMPPNPLHMYTHAFCGNRVIDAGEQCDCGSFKRCAHDQCCLLDCTLKPGAKCASGLCCKNCHFMPPGTLCRDTEDECDLPEWCNGTSPHCPEDVYLLNGSPCLGTGFCYKKRCNSRDEQCRKIFGEKARNAQAKCYEEMNTRGDRFGNCGLTSSNYIKCPLSDVLCGRVQCENISQIPSLEGHSNIHWTHFNEVNCWSIDYHWGVTKQDIGDIKDGTECGLRHMCLSRRCVIKSSWPTSCSPKECNMRGVCNNKHHCHCNTEWDPPNCWEKGFGGSIDSGPTPEKYAKLLQEKRAKKKLYLMSVLLLCFGVLAYSLFIVYLKGDGLFPSSKHRESFQEVTEEPMMAGGEGYIQTRVAVFQLWFVVLLLSLGLPQIGQAQHHSPPEVVIPLKLNGPGGAMKTIDKFSYSLYFGGQRHLVHLKANTFLVPRLFSVFTYTDQGALLEDQPFVQNDCYYQGFVEGYSESLVVVNICFGGIQGTLQINDMLYEIKPKLPSATFEHLVYKMDSEETYFPHMRCAVTEEIAQLKFQGSDDDLLRQSSYTGWWTHRCYLELALIVDNQRVNYHKSNTSKVIREVFIIVSHVSVILNALDIEVSLLGLEIWNEKNPILGNTIDALLTNFCTWKTKNGAYIDKYDIVHLFIHQNLGVFLGKAYIGTVCHPWNCGVDRVINENYFYIGHTVAHEIGHNLNMQHDVSYCNCGKKYCLMSPTQSSEIAFSNCSYVAFLDILQKKDCMRLPPNPLDRVKYEVCGNGVLEDGEECDCGSFKMCEEDPCCLANCTLTSEAECASGLCCQGCHFMELGTVCREKDNECDLPEWCNGTSEHCPEDVYVQDWSPCLIKGYCYEKRCNHRDEQCQKIFGEKSRSASQTCYKAINMQGDRFGNCGLLSNQYVRCNISDILCGRIQCERVTEIPRLEDHSTIHLTHFNKVLCWSTDYHWGTVIPDIGDVKDGTECGRNRVCLNRKCVRRPSWSTVCSPTKCNFQGICNNKDHCHCNLGWDPPFCLGKGFGGSLDSGPPPGQRMRKSKGTALMKTFLRIFFLLSLIVWILVCLVLYYLSRLRRR